MPDGHAEGGCLTPSIIASALDELWERGRGPQPGPLEPGAFDGLTAYLSGLRNVFPRTNAWRYLDWTVRVDLGGDTPVISDRARAASIYRLVIENGAIIGLAYDEDPWPWGDPRWLTSHLIADHEMRRITMMPHACTDECVCPRHGTPLYYWPFGDDHACQDYTCPFARGIRAMVGATLDLFPQDRG
jgi:hypothetical protein